MFGQTNIGAGLMAYPKKPLNQLSTVGSPAHQVMQVTDDTDRCKDYMQILVIPMSKKNYKGLIKPQFLFLNDRN